MSNSGRRFVRIPAVLAVVVVGATTTAVLSFSSCAPDRGPEPVDATTSSSVKVDAAIDGGN